MNELEEKADSLKNDIKEQEQLIESMKTTLWNKKKDLKALNEAIRVLKGTEKEDDDEEYTGLPLPIVS